MLELRRAPSRAPPLAKGFSRSASASISPFFAIATNKSGDHQYLGSFAFPFRLKFCPVTPRQHSDARRQQPDHTKALHMLLFGPVLG